MAFQPNTTLKVPRLTSSFYGRGESAVGKWTVIVKDTATNEHSGTFLDWRFSLWGESIDGDIQDLHPLPNEHDHDHETQTASRIATTTVPTGGAKPPSPTDTDDHVHRPVNAKPGQPSATATIPLTPSASPTSSGTPFSDNFLPSPFPTFGVSIGTQLWIYAALGLIIIFFAALGIYFWAQRRKRIRNNPRDDYEFEMVADDESRFPLTGGAAGGKRAQRRRGGELYDAFAGESDEEGILNDEDEHEDEHDSDDEPYHDDGTKDDVELSEKSRPPGNEERDHG